MRKIAIIFVLVFLLWGLNAQDSEVQTLFGSGTRISGFGGPIMSFTSINGEFAHMMGGGGCVLLGDFFIGGYGEGLTNSIMAGGNRIKLRSWRILDRLFFHGPQGLASRHFHSTGVGQHYPDR